MLVKACLISTKVYAFDLPKVTHINLAVEMIRNASDRWLKRHGVEIEDLGQRLEWIEETEEKDEEVPVPSRNALDHQLT